MPGDWVLIFSDGTGQRGVRDDTGVKGTNIFAMYHAVKDKPGFKSFYDAGLGAPDEEKLKVPRFFRNLASKATGWGITANIVDCYEQLMMLWQPGMKIGFFGFSRGAYTVRCLGGVLATCGIATRQDGKPVSLEKENARRRAIAQEAVDIYKMDRDKEEAERKAKAAAFRTKCAAADVVPDVVGVFDTVRALGLPVISDAVKLVNHVFHDNTLNSRVPVGLQALSIDENRKEFKAELWDDPAPNGQIIEQCWFPGVHSDIGGGYDDDRGLSDLTLAWMLERLRVHAGLDIPLDAPVTGNVRGKQHDERTGLGVFWWPAARTPNCKQHDDGFLCGPIEDRYKDLALRYRPEPLKKHPRVQHLY